MYYFFSASLPELRAGQPPPFTLEEFDAEARLQLTERHYAQLTVNPEDESAVLPRVYREMRRFEQYLRTRIAARRAEKLNLPLELPEPEELYSEVDAALPALAAAEPAERERGIDALRWQRLDEITQNHDFDFDHICAYRVKLALAGKYRGREAGAGREHFDSAVREIATR